MYEKIVIFNTLLYPLWCFYFSRQILRGRLSPSKTYLCILFMHIILIIGSYELMPDKVPFIFVHLASFLSIVLLHSDSFKKKLFAYFLYTCTIMLMEMLIMCLYVSVKKIIFHQNAGFISMNSVTTVSDAVTLCIIILTVGSLMWKKMSDRHFHSFLQHCTSYADFLSLLLALYYAINSMQQSV